MNKNKMKKLLNDIENLVNETSEDELAMCGEHLLADEIIEMIKKAKK